MKMLLNRILTALLASGFVSAAILVPQCASAGQFGVKPIKIFLTKNATSVVLTVENQASEPLRLQVTGFGWNQDQKGEMQLKSTDDLVFFPTLLTLQPLESRSVRIGITVPAGDKERTYRVFLEELPSLTSQLTKTGSERLEVRTKVGVPIFLAPSSEVKKSALGDLSLKRGNLIVPLTNAGSVHNMVDSIKVIAKDAGGSKIYDKTIRGWYVLAGETRDFQVAIPKAQCAKTRSVAVTVETENGNFNHSLSAPTPDCSAK